LRTYKIKLIEFSLSIKDFRSYRLRFIEKIIKKVLVENKDVKKVITAKQAAGRVCLNSTCNTTYKNLKSKCDVCGSKVIKTTRKEVELKSNVSLVTAKENILNATVIKSCANLKTREPTMVNPNSYDTVVLK